LLRPEELDLVAAQRERVARRLGLWQRDADRAATATVAKGPSRAVPALYARAETVANGRRPAVAPSFDEFEVDVWGKRRATLQRFVFLVGKWVVRKRAARRLKALKARLAGAATREEVRSLVELDDQVAQSASKQPKAEEGAGSEAALRFEPPVDCIQPTLFPCYEEDSSSVRLPIAAGSGLDLGFLDYSYLHLKVPQESEVLGYGPAPPPPVDSFAPPARQGLRTGAVEETGVRPPRDSTPGWNLPPPVAADPAAPPGSTVAPSAVMAALYGWRAHEAEESPAVAIDALLCPAVARSRALERPRAAACAFASVGMPIETDADWVLRPQPVLYDVPNTYGSRVANGCGAASLHALRAVPTLAEAWRPRRQRRSSALFCLEEQHRQLLWQHQGLPRTQPAAADAMSDSESDDEGDDVSSAAREGMLCRPRLL
jgi:hypothetical protein